MKVTAVFDIGKTNKKFFLFDEDYKEVHSQSIEFEEIQDEDAYPCDDVARISKWIVQTLNTTLNSDNYEVDKVNFSAYGASLVHVDKEGHLVAPLYNYLKKYPTDILDQFYSTYGTEISLAKETASQNQTSTKRFAGLFTCRST